MNSSSEALPIPAKSGKGLTILMGLSLPLAIVLKMGFFFLLIGMLPTLITMMVIRAPKPYVVSTVAAFNFAGVFPDLLTIALQGGHLTTVLDTLANPTVWASMYGAGLLGIGLVWLSPAIALMLLEYHYRGRMRQLENIQKKMEEEWGPDIAGRGR